MRASITGWLVLALLLPAGPAGGDDDAGSILLLAGRLEVPGSPSLLLEASGVSSLAVHALIQGQGRLALRRGRPFSRFTADEADLLAVPERFAQRIDVAGPLVPGRWYVALLGAEATGAEAFVLAVGSRSPRRFQDGWLALGGPPSTLVLGGVDGKAAQTFAFEVPPGTRAVEIVARAQEDADVDIYASRLAPPDAEAEDAQWFAATLRPAERLVLGGEGELRPGRYHARRILVESDKPRRVEVLARKVVPPAPTWGAVRPQPVTPGAWREGTVWQEPGRQETGGVAWHRFRVPPGVRRFVAMLQDAEAPLDLLVADVGDGRILARSLSARVDERLDIAVSDDLPRDLLLGVLSRDPSEKRISYRVAIAFDQVLEPPPDRLWPPRLTQEVAGPFRQAIAATVDISNRSEAGGSGTCVTPRGWVLTCRHVVEDEETSRVQREGILVAFPTRIDRPPVQAWIYRLMWEDEDTDLALLAPVRDVFGRSVPRDYEFPYVPLGQRGPLELGEPLVVLGYPADGSLRARTPILLSRGELVGLEERQGQLRWIKTAAFVAHGHSGGGIYDAQGRLVGLPALLMGEQAALTLGAPVSLLPASWRRRIAEHGPNADGGRAE